jgi:tetratricopeptide (TPR) repeat protein
MNLINHLSELESAGLVSLTQVSPDVEYLFKHTMVQEAAYASLLDEDVSHLHHLVGEAIETLYPDRLDEMAPSLGRHFELAGEHEKAATYYKIAGEKALGTYSHQEASGHFRKALQLCKNKQERAELLVGLGESLAMMGLSEEAIQTWQEGIAIYKQLGDLENIAYLYARAGRVVWFSKNQGLGLELCEEGMALVREAPESHGLAMLLHETARAYFFNGRQEEALPLCKQALAMAERLGTVNVQAESLTTLGILPQVPADERLALLKQAVELAESAGMLHIAARAHLNLGSAYISQLGDQKKGRQHYQRAADLARRCAATQSEFFYLTAVAEVSLGLGELDEFERILSELERLAVMLPDKTNSQVEVKLMQIWPQAYRGHWDKVIHVLKEQIAETQTTDNPKQLVDYCLTIVRAMAELHRLGEPIHIDEAFGYMKTAYDNVSKTEIAHFTPLLRAISAVLEAYRGNYHEARQHFKEAGIFQKDYDPTKRKDFVQSLFLEFTCLEGSWSEAIETYHQIKADHRNLGLFDWARVLLLAAEAYLKRGEPDDLEEAQVLLQEAGAIYTKLQAPVYLEQVEALVKATRAQTFVQAAAQRQVAKELAQAGRLQSSFLPEEPPNMPGWQAAAKLRPSQADFRRLL